MNDVLLKATQLKKYFSIARASGVGIKKKEKAFIKAVDDVEFTVSQGETVAIVGESGSGKTTLSRLMLMLDSPDSGELYFKGKNIESFSKKEHLAFKKAIQPVFQNPVAALNPRMRIKDIIAEPLLFLSEMLNGDGKTINRSANDLSEKVFEVLEKVGLKVDDAEKFPHQFSGGQRQRIAIARALISEPELIILDEPVASQDISIQAQILNLLKDLQEKDNLSFVFIAHDLATVKFLSDKIYVMYFGKVVESGTTEELFAKPLHPYTKNLLASHLPSHPDNRDDLFENDHFEGEAPSPLDPPVGCNFQSRCPYKQPVCEQEQALQTVGNQQVACIRFSEI
ncbi:MAG: ATP-binding cassette domain-containing protein [Cellvibrionaceae bacterium]